MQVKAEIREVVQFLRNPRRFLDLGARSPAGILLVGPPGTGVPLNYSQRKEEHTGLLSSLVPVCC